MKPEVKDIVVELTTKTVPAGGLVWLSNVNWTAFLAALLLILQIAYTVRRWWREETEWGLRLRRWAERKGWSKPIELDE